MGVDIGTYRSRIGTFRHGPGLDVVLLRVCVNYSGCLKVVGVVAFIGILLLMAGVEANPGPVDNPKEEKALNTEGQIPMELNKESRLVLTSTTSPLSTVPVGDISLCDGAASFQRAQLGNEASIRGDKMQSLTYSELHMTTKGRDSLYSDDAEDLDQQGIDAAYSEDSDDLDQEIVQAEKILLQMQKNKRKLEKEKRLADLKRQIVQTKHDVLQLTESVSGKIIATKKTVPVISSSTVHDDMTSGDIGYGGEGDGYVQQVDANTNIDTQTKCESPNLKIKTSRDRPEHAEESRLTSESVSGKNVATEKSIPVISSSNVHDDMTSGDIGYVGEGDCYVQQVDTKINIDTQTNCESPNLKIKTSRDRPEHAEESRLTSENVSGNNVATEKSIPIISSSNVHDDRTSGDIGYGGEGDGYVQQVVNTNIDTQTNCESVNLKIETSRDGPDESGLTSESVSCKDVATEKSIPVISSSNVHDDVTSDCKSNGGQGDGCVKQVDANTNIDTQTNCERPNLKIKASRDGPSESISGTHFETEKSTPVISSSNVHDDKSNVGQGDGYVQQVDTNTNIDTQTNCESPNLKIKASRDGPDDSRLTSESVSSTHFETEKSTPVISSSNVHNDRTSGDIGNGGEGDDNVQQFVNTNIDTQTNCESPNLKKETSRDEPDESGLTSESVNGKHVATEKSIPVISSSNVHDDMTSDCKSNGGQGDGYVKQVDDNTNIDCDPTDTIPKPLLAMLKRLNLIDWFPGKITNKDVAAIVEAEEEYATKPVSELPWLILQQIIMANKHARDQIAEQVLSQEMQDDFCPLDVFIAVFHCCDAMLKQLIYQKMHMCKLAVPFLYIDPHSLHATVPVWPLRSIVIEWNDCNGRSQEYSVCKQKTKVVLFARFGRPLFSKSKLQNELLSMHKHDTFFHKDCPLGTSDRSLSLGYVEASWYLPSSGTTDFVDEVVMFANVRGDLGNDFNDNQIQYLAQLGHVFIIIVDIQYLQKNVSTLLTLLEMIARFQSVIIILNNPQHLKHITASNEIQNISLLSKEVIMTHKNEKEKSANEMVKTVRNFLKTYLKPHSGMQIRITDISKFGIKSDEDNNECIIGRLLAGDIFSEIKLSGEQEMWKSNVTPLQLSHWHKWSELNKKLHRSINQIEDTEKVTKEMSDIRKSQLGLISKTMEMFTKVIVDNIENKSIMFYFIEWLRLDLDDMSRSLLPVIRGSYYDVYDRLKQMRRNESDSGDNTLEEQVKELENKLVNSSFGVENLFREMGQIYEAKRSVKVPFMDRQIPDLQTISKTMAKLVYYGQPLELLDGEASNIPKFWIQSVFDELNSLIGSKPVITLSVLGIQSSGKSTLLNTMFGLQFPVSAGRCTRGVYMQLLPIKHATNLPFDYVMVIDSEGLRAPELMNRTKDHDNELATFVIGLSDITLLTIKGENPIELNDILEITVHAFFKLKAADTNLDLRQMCMFVHQNVATKHDNLRYVVNKLVEKLDNMTKEAALLEDIHDITSFNQVIQFDELVNVRYLPDLWNGELPMAAVSDSYSTHVRALKNSIFQMATSDGRMSYKSMSDICVHANDLWKGILHEDFVFGFKNTLEIKAYLQMETEYTKLSCTLEGFVKDWTHGRLKVEFSKCKSDYEIDRAAEEIRKALDVIMSKQTTITRNDLELFMEKSEYSEILLNWKGNKVVALTMFSENLRLTQVNEIAQSARIRKFEILASSLLQQHEKRLYEESIKLVADLKGKHLSPTEADLQFERIWKTCVIGVESEMERENDFGLLSIKALFIEQLNSIFKTDVHTLRTELRNYNNLDTHLKIQKLYGSFSSTGISTADINMHVLVWLKDRILMKKDEMYSLEQITDVIFLVIDLRIKQLSKEDAVIESIHISRLFHELKDLIDRPEKNSSHKYGFKLKNSYRIKVCVHISCYAQHVFEERNNIYKRKHGIKARINLSKIQARTRFMAYLQERKAEVTAATLFSNEIEDFVRENVAERLSFSVEQRLMTMLPSIKYHLIIDVLTDLVQNGSFNDFMGYFASPEIYANVYISNSCEQYLFSVSSHKYFDLAVAEIHTILSDVRSGIADTTNKMSKNSTMSDWIDFFSTSLSECSIEIERLRVVEREQVTDFGNFKICLEKEISTVEKSLTQEFKKLDMESVKWKKTNPLIKVFERLWGCTETCVFCCEPCSKCANHSPTSTHHCIQHKPSGLNGICTKDTHEIWLSSCNFDIQSNETYKCALLDYLCNPSELKACAKGVHPFKEFRKYLPSWDIEPSSSMRDTCKLWMWFMATYRRELAEHHDFRTDNIPAEWEKITKEEALESLRHSYT